MLRAIMRTIRRVLSAIGRGIERTLGALFGSGGVPALPSAEFEEVVDEQAEDLRHELESFPEAVPPAPSTLGARIHAYAAGSADDRAGFDFDGMPDEVALTLVSLTEGQLARLAASGLVVCGRWALGEKTGLVGVPAPATLQTAPDADAAPDETEGSEHAPAPAAVAA